MASRMLQRMVGDDYEEDEEDYDQEYDDDYDYDQYEDDFNDDDEYEKKPASRTENRQNSPLVGKSDNYCNTCECSFKISIQEHEMTQKHRNMVFDKRVKVAQASRAQQSDNLTKLIEEAFSFPNILLKIIGFLPTAEILPLRLVSGRWHKLLSSPKRLRLVEFKTNHRTEIHSNSIILVHSTNS
jgi:hypothetical protein